jgi:hypothetical protein
MKRYVMRSILWFVLALTLVACTPALNWRQVNVDASDVMVFLPCKPDQATRTVALRVVNQDVETSLSLYGCEASQMHFTFGHMEAQQGLSAEESVSAWRLASLAALNVKPSDATSQDWAIQGVSDHGVSARTLVLTGTHQVQWVWFAYDNKIYQAAVYGKTKDKGLPEAAETYFSGIKLP